MFLEENYVIQATWYNQQYEDAELEKFEMKTDE